MSITLNIETSEIAFPEYPDELTPPCMEVLSQILEERTPLFGNPDKRKALAEILREEHIQQNAPRNSLENIARLASPETFAVVAGQQPGLMTGPLYTPWKVLSAILLVEKLNRERPEQRFVPVFWNAGEDHDTAEMDHFEWLDKKGMPVRFDMNPLQPGEPISFASRPISQLNTERLFSFWDETLFETEFSEQLSNLVRESIDSAENMGEMCNQLLWRLFAKDGLVIVNSWPGSLYRLAVERFRQEIQQPGASGNAVNEAGKVLKSLGIEPQMHKAAGRCSFFLKQNGYRQSVRFEDDVFHAGNEKYTQDEFLSLLEEQPKRFSPAANLRPVIQDALLPTAVSVLGPGEYAYHLQIKQIYEAHGVPQPVGVRRQHIALLPPRIRKHLEKYDLGLEDLSESREKLSQSLALESGGERFQQVSNNLRHEIEVATDGMQVEAEALDKSLAKSISGYKKQLMDLVDKMEARYGKALRKQNSQLEKTIERLQATVFPNGQPQERSLNIFYFLNLFGLELLEELHEALNASEPGGEYRVWIEGDD